VLTTATVQKEWRLAGGINRLFQPSRFLDDGEMFLTKAGALGLVYRLTGVDFEGLDHEQRRLICYHYETALRVLDSDIRVYQYIHKRKSAPIEPAACTDARVGRLVEDRAAFLNAAAPLYDIDLFVVLLYEGMPPRPANRGTRLSTKRTVSFLLDQVRLAQQALNTAAYGFEQRLVSLGPQRLAKAEAFQFFRRLVNFSDPGVRLKHDTHIDFHMADEMVEERGDHLVVGHTPVRVLSMKDSPSQTHAAMFEDFYAIPGEFIACVEWRREPVEVVKLALSYMRTHFHNTALPILGFLFRGQGTSDVLTDRGKEAMVDQLGTAMGDLELSGHFYGACSLTLVLVGADAERAAAAAERVLALADGKFICETYNALNAWVSIVPGNVATNVRHLRMLETHCADLSCLFSVSQGQRDVVAGRGPITVFDTPHGTPYWYGTHVRDVGHTLITGNTGEGKSVTGSFLLSMAQQHHPQTVVLDFGQSYRGLGDYLGGSYLEFGMDAGVAINPLAHEGTKAQQQFVHDFVKMLIEGTDGYRMTDAMERQLSDKIAALYDPAFPVELRRLSGLRSMLPPPWNARLDKWLEGERFGHLFDHVTDQVGLSTFQVFEFEAMKAYPDLLAPLLFYVFHRVNTAVHSGQRLMIVTLVEAAQFLQNPTIRAQVETALDTWRKYDAAMILETQSVEQLKDPTLLRTVIERCKTKLFLPNESLDRAKHQELFGLNDMAIHNLVHLRARQMLLQRPDGTRVLNITIDPTWLWLYETPSAAPATA
jgi:type IV secretion/conjugal transfer VirB4 family ATPase